MKLMFNYYRVPGEESFIPGKLAQHYTCYCKEDSREKLHNMFDMKDIIDAMNQNYFTHISCCQICIDTVQQYLETIQGFYILKCDFQEGILITNNCYPHNIHKLYYEDKKGFTTSNRKVFEYHDEVVLNTFIDQLQNRDIIMYIYDDLSEDFDYAFMTSDGPYGAMCAMEAEDEYEEKLQKAKNLFEDLISKLKRYVTLHRLSVPLQGMENSYIVETGNTGKLTKDIQK
jgi:hypothetical protein